MKIAILGTAPNSKLLAPFQENEWEIWCCSPGNRGGIIPRVTRWFELHGITDIKGPENSDWNQAYFDWLNTQSFPVYMQEPNDLCPQARVFPRKAWLDEFGDWGRLAATSSISWMIGFAIMSGAHEIAIFGVDMADSSEAYTNQKSGCQIMMLLAKERGIKVTIPLESCLATKPPLYGYAEASRMGRRMLVRELTLVNEINACQARMNHEERMLNQLRGALDQVQYFRRTFVDGETDAELDIVEAVAINEDGTTTHVAHSKGTTVEFEHHRPVVIPDIAGADYEEQRGVLVPAKTFVPKPDGRFNSGEYPVEE